MCFVSEKQTHASAVPWWLWGGCLECGHLHQEHQSAPHHNLLIRHHLALARCMHMQSPCQRSACAMHDACQPPISLSHKRLVLRIIFGGGRKNFWGVGGTL